jgi:hypothetical protein
VCVEVKEGVKVGVNVEEAVVVKACVFVKVGEGVTLGPNSWPGPQAERNRIRMAKVKSIFIMRSFVQYFS